MANYFAKVKGQVSGPFDAEQLKRLAASGEISPDDEISKDAKSGWVAANNVRGLFPAADWPPQATAANSPAAEPTNSKGFGDIMLDAMPSGFMTRRRRIAITGLANTGKTVFLTTLINHLKHHDPSTFRLFKENGDITVKEFTEVEIESGGLRHFDHSIYAQSMRTGRWPRKTVDVSNYTCRFNTDHHWVNHQVEFLDWPGERVADVIMYKRDYAGWSDYLLNHWEVAEDDYRKHVSPYLNASQRSGLVEKKILAEYRLAMGRLILDFNPLISPSCFLVGRDGNKLRGDSPEQLAALGVSGLNAESQFAPLPKESRSRQPELAAIFAERFAEYRKQIVCGLFDAVQHCNRLIVLVDIPAILASGDGRLNDNYEMVDEMLKGFEANAGKAKGILKNLWHSVTPASWMWMGVEKIAFVATKADLVAGEENKSNLLKLLKGMLRDIENRIPSIEIGYFVASPVSSTQHPPDSQFLTGKPMFDDEGNFRAHDAPETSYAVSAVPDKWPERWPSGQFHFPPVYPALPKGRFMLPKHIGLDSVLQFVIE